MLNTREWVGCADSKINKIHNVWLLCIVEEEKEGTPNPPLLKRSVFYSKIGRQEKIPFAFRNYKGKERTNYKLLQFRACICEWSIFWLAYSSILAIIWVISLFLFKHIQQTVLLDRYSKAVVAWLTWSVPICPKSLRKSFYYFHLRNQSQIQAKWFLNTKRSSPPVDRHCLYKIRDTVEI